ncbi:MAG: regulatory protein GemA [Hyphomicrobiaceae bacterium]|nr:regulatory protein GemA [Hyphomicrobiaceae bacterium]
MTASAAQRGLIHALSKQAGLGEGERRELLRTIAGVSSTTELSGGGAAAVIDRLKELSSWQSPTKGAIRLDGPYAGKIRATWITGHQLGMVRDRTDAAMLAFVLRQTGISHTRWLRDADAARKVVEALKGWIERESGWAYDDALTPLGHKLTILRAQWARLIRLGLRPRAGNADWALEGYAAATVGRTNLMTLGDLAEAEADQVIAALGRKIHKLQAGKA